MIGFFDGILLFFGDFWFNIYLIDCSCWLRDGPVVLVRKSITLFGRCCVTIFSCDLKGVFSNAFIWVDIIAHIMWIWTSLDDSRWRQNLLLLINLFLLLRIKERVLLTRRLYDSTSFLLHTDWTFMILELTCLHLILNNLRLKRLRLLLKRFVCRQDLIHDFLRSYRVSYFTRRRFAFLVCQKVLIYWLSLKPYRLLLLYCHMLILLGRSSQWKDGLKYARSLLFLPLRRLLSWISTQLEKSLHWF